MTRFLEWLACLLGHHDAIYCEGFSTDGDCIRCRRCEHVERIER